MLVPPPPAPRRRWGSNCSSCGERIRASFPFMKVGTHLLELLSPTLRLLIPLPHDAGGSWHRHAWAFIPLLP